MAIIIKMFVSSCPLQDYASFFAGQVVQEAVCVLRQDPDFQDFGMKDPQTQDVDIFAENLSDQILRDVFLSGSLVSGGDGTGLGNKKAALDVSGVRRSLARIPASQGGEKESRLRYYGEGARPKVRTFRREEEYGRKLHAQSPAKDIPPRKLVRRSGTDAEGRTRETNLSYEHGRSGTSRSKREERKPRQHYHLHIPSLSTPSPSGYKNLSPSSVSQTGDPRLIWSLGSSQIFPDQHEFSHPGRSHHQGLATKLQARNIPGQPRHSHIHSKDPKLKVPRFFLF